MTNANQNKSASPEVQAPKPQTPEQKDRIEGKEVKEASISVGIEAGEIIEGAEIEGTGEVRETEKSTKEGAGSAGKATAGQTAVKRELKIPPVAKMEKQIEKVVKKEIKNLHKKLKKVVKKRDANSLNSLVARLRELKNILNILATATAEKIKELWISYVKESKT